MDQHSKTPSIDDEGSRTPDTKQTDLGTITGGDTRGNGDRQADDNPSQGNDRQGTREQSPPNK